MKQLHIHMDDESHKRFKKYAIDNGKTMKQIVTEFIDDLIGTHVGTDSSISDFDRFVATLKNKEDKQ